MKLTMVICAVLATAAAPAWAEGDAVKGKTVFNQCQTCHSVVDAEGNVLAGKGAKVGPNLFGLFGRTAGTLEGFKYGPAIIAAGAAGLVWDEVQFVDYVQNPTAFLKKTLNDTSAASKMSFKVKDETAAANVYAYLAELSPPAAPADAAAGTTSP